jgi:hypothetical protein
MIWPSGLVTHTHTQAWRENNDGHFRDGGKTLFFIPSLSGPIIHFGRIEERETYEQILLAFCSFVRRQGIGIIIGRLAVRQVRVSNVPPTRTMEWNIYEGGLFPQAQLNPSYNEKW